MKKLISALLVCCMVLLMFPASAAEEAAAQPTIEEILNEYHAKAFEAQSAGDSGSTSTWSRNTGSSKTLEQETVDTLTEAGYEAYNVTAENYASLEADLNTDFAELGLDPDGSYIMVINGDASQRAIGDSEIVPTPGGTEGGSGIRHTYGDETYTMRSVTIASTADAALQASFNAKILQAVDGWEENEDIYSYLTSWLIASDGYGMTASGAYSLWANWSSAESYIILDDSSSPTLTATTNWTLRYTQVWDDVLNRWATSQCSSYAVTKAKVEGVVHNHLTAECVAINSGEKTVTVYSSHYNSYDRYDLAAKGFIENDVYRDYADVGFYFFNNDGECINADGTPLFVLSETVKALYPSYDYED